jgi:hypothetical protein
MLYFNAWQQKIKAGIEVTGKVQEKSNRLVRRPIIY